MSDSILHPDSGSSSSTKSAVLFGAVIALVAANVYLYLQIDGVKSEQVKVREQILTELTNIKEASTVSSATARRSIDTLKTEMESTRRTAIGAATNAKTEAQQYSEKLAQKLAEEQREQKKSVAQVASAITEVKEVASTAHSKIGEVSGDVSQVRTQVAATKSELDKTIAELKTVRGDLGVTSGLVATNGKELSALKRLGERNYFEFKLGKTKEPQRVGDVTILLKKADLKRNRYTIEVFADDKRTEKRDRTINEPVQFYVAKARLPYEIVVNEVKKDSITGYLATPKDNVARN